MWRLLELFTGFMQTFFSCIKYAQSSTEKVTTLFLSIFFYCSPSEKQKQHALIILLSSFSSNYAEHKGQFYCISCNFWYAKKNREQKFHRIFVCPRSRELIVDNAVWSFSFPSRVFLFRCMIHICINDTETEFCEQAFFHTLSLTLSLFDALYAAAERKWKSFKNYYQEEKF